MKTKGRLQLLLDVLVVRAWRRVDRQGELSQDAVRGVGH